MSEKLLPRPPGTESLAEPTGKNSKSAIAKHKSSIPVLTASELYENDSLSTIFRQSALSDILNSEPKKEWIKAHPTAKLKIIDENGNEKSIPLPYIPISRVEWLLKNIFIKYRIEVKDTKLIGNSVSVTVRVYYFDHILNEWDWQDGLGACPLQTDKGAGAVDFSALKSSAVQIAAPAAESYAIKDACEKIGNIFGANIARNYNADYESIAQRYQQEVITADTLNARYEAVSDKLSVTVAENIRRIIDNNETTSFKKAMREMENL